MSSKKLAWLVSSLFLFTLCSAAQEAEKFSARTELVVLPVLVSTKAGHHVTGLRKEDFTLTENGVEQKIAFFEEVRTTKERLHRAAPQENTFSNFLSGQPTPKRVTIIVLDLLNTEFIDQVYARKGLLDFLGNSVDATEPIAVFLLTRSGLKVVHDFTTDPQVLVEAVKRIKGAHDQVAVPVADQTRMSDAKTMLFDSAVASDASALQSMTDAAKQAEISRNSQQQRLAIVYTLEAMQQLARAFGGLPGRKSVIWATGGFPFDVSDTTMQLAAPGQMSLQDVLPIYERTWQLLNDANIAIYAVDAKGLVGPSIGSAGLQSSRMNNPFAMAQDSWARLNSIDALRVFANETGGKAFFNSNDIAGGFQKAAEDSAQYYVLAYYLDHTKKKPGWHKLGVTVKGDLTVRARSGFLLTKTTADWKSTQVTDMDMAVRSPIDYTEIPMRLRWTKIGPGKNGGSRSVEYYVDLPAGTATVDEQDDNHVRLEFVAAIRKPDGKDLQEPDLKVMDAHVKKENIATLSASGITYRNVIEVPPGEYNVRFVVRDGITGKMGSVGATLKVN